MKTCHIFVSAILSFLAVISVQAGQYFQDFSSSAVGATTFSDGSTLQSSNYTVAQVVDATYKELQLTASGTTGTESAYLLPDLDSNTPVYAFSAKWNMLLYGDFPNAADGFSFNYGQLGSTNLVASTSQETGYGAGLSFDVQTYYGNNPGFYIRAGTNIVASFPYNTTAQWGVNNSTRHLFELDWNYYTGMTVRMDGTNLFSNVAITNFTPRAGDRFVFAARCGSLSEYVRLDNIYLVTGGNLVLLPPGTPYSSSAGDSPTNPVSNVFDGDNTTYWANTNTATGIWICSGTFLPTNAVAAYSLTSANTFNATTDPKTWTLEGINGGVVWNLCAGGAGYFENRQETRCFPATNLNSYQTYRLRVSATESGSGGVALGELRLYAFSQVGTPLRLNNWIPVNLPSGSWSSIACSTNGTVVIAANYNSGQVYVSRDSGTTWTLTPASGKFVCSSANGLALSTLTMFGTAYYSTNSGSTWISSSFPDLIWTAIAPTAGFGNLDSFFAVSYGSPPPPASGAALLIESSYNGSTGGLTYGIYQKDNGQYGGDGWSTVCFAQASGALAVSTPSGYVYYSSDGGMTTHQSSIPETASWSAMASSYNGNLMLLGGIGNDNATIIKSTDSGATWSLASTPNAVDISAFAATADGTQWLAATTDGLFTSSDSAATWTLTTAPVQSWTSAASSVDGSRLFAGANSGLVYTTSPTNTSFVTGPLAPMLRQAPGGNISYSELFWPTNGGGNFVLQQTPALSPPNWQNVSWPVVTANGYYQVIIPRTSASFFRLKSY